MAKTKISEYDATAGNNTDINSINISEGMLPSNVNNSLRQMMADLKKMDVGTDALTSPQLTSVDINGGTIDGAVIGGSSAAAGSFTTGQFGTSLNVDGTVTADALTVDGDVTISDSTPSLTLSDADGTNQTFTLTHNSATSTFDVRNNVSHGNVVFRSYNGTSYQNKLRLDDSGDISFYEDTGTTAKLFWDASAESLGIGVSNPSSYYSNANNLVVGDTADTAGITIASGFNSDGYLAFADGTSGDAAYKGFIRYAHVSTNSMMFGTNGTERMRIDSSGNVLVGKTSLDFGANAGAEFRNADGRVFIGSTDGVFVNRIGSDGSIIGFRKDGSPVGSIGIESGGLVIDGESGHTGLRFANDSVLPRDNGTTTNNEDDLGASTAQWRNLYLGGGVVFGPASASTVSSQTLDSYEEGTFTVGFTGATISAGVTTAHYTKVGSVVTWSYYSGVAALSSSSGNAVLTGLPFIVRNNSAAYTPMVTSHNTFFGGSATVGVTGYHSTNATSCVFVVTGQTTSATFVDGTNKYLMVTGTYFTDV